MAGLTACLAVALIGAAAAAADFNSALHSSYTKAVKAARSEIEGFAATVDAGELCADFGAASDAVCNGALEAFSAAAPDVSDGEAAAFDATVAELEAAVDTPLKMLYVRQLMTLRDTALERFKAASGKEEVSEWDAMVEADQYFCKEAEGCTRAGSDWDYATERTSLRSTMSEIAKKGKKLTDTKLAVAQQQQQYMQLFQQQQQQIQQLQAQQYGSSSPWNVGLAYRIPDTNINLSGGYQQGKTTMQLSCVPDDSAGLLGPNGFTKGVGPGNLGLTLNLNV